MPRLTNAEKRAQKERERVGKAELKRIKDTLSSITADSIDAIDNIPQEEWDRAQAEDEAEEGGEVEEGASPSDVIVSERDWRPLLEDMSRVMKLVHLAGRWDMVDQESLRSQLLRSMRKFYDSELGIMAEALGCTGQAGQLRNGPILSRLSEIANDDAAGIVSTFNYDLAIAITHIRAEVPTANRHVYAYRLRKWGKARAKWKDVQIATTTETKARLQAQQDFLDQNGRLMENALLTPRTAVCPICKGWIARGLVPVNVAMQNPPPYHTSCPHVWSFRPAEKLDKESCRLLWMGE